MLMEMQGIGLLLIGHGASRGGGGPVRRLAAKLREMQAFAEVQACFWKERPLVPEGLSLLTCPLVVVVPVFATEGRIARELIPAQLRLEGGETLRPDGARILYLSPVGAHPQMARLADARARKAAGEAGFDMSKTALMLIAHGNRNGGGARVSAENLAWRISRSAVWSSVTALFLEEEPRAADWNGLIRERDIVALPLLLAEGQHAAQDVAPLFGLSSLDGDHPSVTEVSGRRVACACGLADDEALAGLIVQMAGEALRRTNPTSA